MDLTTQWPSGASARRHASRKVRTSIGRICRVGLFAVTLGFLQASVAAPRASADEGSGASVVYSDAYQRLIAAAPSGLIEECEAWIILKGASAGTVCDARIDLVYFYPDGTLGGRPWSVDVASPTGWSVAPDPCTGLADHDAARWASYVDFINGYLDDGPVLSVDQIEQYGGCWGWWF